jgi:hypothetical protein
MGKGLFAGLFWVWGIAACSSGSGAGNPGITSGGSTCDAVCQKAGTLNCGNPNFTTSECMTNCDEEYANDPCAASGLGLSMCTLEKFGCDVLSGNLDGVALLQQCGAQSSAYLACSACVVDEEDSDCEACQKTSCCTQRKALYQSSEIIGYTQCASSCTDAGCAQNCLDQYPSIVALQQAQVECQNQKCLDACSATGGGG